MLVHTLVGSNSGGGSNFFFDGERALWMGNCWQRYLMLELVVVVSC